MHTLRSVPLDRLGTHRFSPFCLGAPGLRLAACVTILVVTPLVASALPSSAHSTNSTLIRLNSLGAGTFATYGVVRSADGTLHLIYQTTRSGSGEVNGLATRSISASGAVGPQTTALSGWGPSTPGLVELPGGRLEAVFGAVSASRVSDLWGITSSDGGKTWAVPVRVGSGAQDEVQAYGAAITAQSAGGEADLHAQCQWRDHRPAGARPQLAQQFAGRLHRTISPRTSIPPAMPQAARS